LKRENLQRIVKFLIKHLTRPSFFGTENVPREGGLIIATNHMSRMDIPFLFVNPVRSDVTALVAEKYASNIFINWFVTCAGAIFIDRSRADFAAFREATKLIKNGIAMGIAPEGTRSHNNQLLEGKAGTVLLALRTAAPIVPVGLVGTEGSFKKVFTLRKPRMSMRFGKPILIDELPRENREEALQHTVDEIMCRIAALLPERYWGFYHNHPRLLELLAEQGGAFEDGVESL